MKLIIMQMKKSKKRIPIYHGGAFHSAQSIKRPERESQIVVLPLLENSAHSLSLIRHVIELMKSGIRHLNPNQVPVIAMDQPLYEIAERDSMVMAKGIRRRF